MALYASPTGKAFTPYTLIWIWRFRHLTGTKLWSKPTALPFFQETTASLAYVSYS